MIQKLGKFIKKKVDRKVNSTKTTREDIINNPYVIVGFFIVMIIYEAFTYLAIYVAKRDTAKLLEKKYNHKRK